MGKRETRQKKMPTPNGNRFSVTPCDIEGQSTMFKEITFSSKVVDKNKNKKEDVSSSSSSFQLVSKPATGIISPSSSFTVASTSSSSFTATSSPSSSSSSLRTRNKLRAASIICAFFVVIQLVGGRLSGSLAIMSDAVHLMTDLLALLISMMASHLALKPSTKKYTFGFHRIESFAALFSVCSLVLVTIWLMYESVLRFVSTLNQPTLSIVVDGAIMSITAVIGMFVNLILALILRENHAHLPGATCNHNHPAGFKCIHEIFNSMDEETGIRSHDSISISSGDFEMPSCVICPGAEGLFDDVKIDDENAEDPPGWPNLPTFLKLGGTRQKHELLSASPNDETVYKKQRAAAATSSNVNLEAAFFHTLTDLVHSFIVLITGCLIWWKPNLHLLDPVLTFLYSFFVLWGAIPIIKRSVSVLLDATPPNISYDEIHDAIRNVIPNVQSICALRIWSVSDGNVGLTCHICVCAPSSDNATNKQNPQDGEPMQMLSTSVLIKKVMTVLKKKFGIDGQFVTIQIFIIDRKNKLCPSCESAPISANVVIV